MGFDFASLFSMCSKQSDTKESGGGGDNYRDAQGNIDWMAIGMKLITVAKPYIVAYLGDVERPENIDMSAAAEAASTAESFKPYESTETYDKGNVRALLIGINYYGSSAELGGCVNDVKQELATFQKVGFPVKEMAILVDEQKGEKFPNKTADPTRENIIKYMAWLVKDAKAGDVLFMHYSGHGSQTKATGPKKDEYEAYDQVICPVDYASKGCILDNDIFDLIAKDLPKEVKLTVLFDCCHSGSMLDLPYQFEAGSGLDSSTHHMKKVRDNNFCQADIIMISGCADSQTSADVGDTKTLGNGTEGAGGAATQCLTYILLNAKKKLSYTEVLIETRDMLKQKRFTQVPQLSASRPIDLTQPFSMTKLFTVDASMARTLPAAYRA